jgi:hypothetical protein
MNILITFGSATDAEEAALLHLPFIRVVNRGQYVGIRLLHLRARSVIRLWTKPRQVSVMLGLVGYSVVDVKLTQPLLYSRHARPQMYYNHLNEAQTAVFTLTCCIFGRAVNRHGNAGFG